MMEDTMANMYKDWVLADRRCQQLEAENDKLRELTIDMFKTFCCFREEPMSHKEELGHEVRFWKRLEELGIEVEP